MGIDSTFALAYAKSQMAAGGSLPTSGSIYLSVRNDDKKAILPVARKLAALGFKLFCTGGTYKAVTEAGIAAERINKIQEGRPNVIDFIKNKQIVLLINTPTTKGPKTDEGKIRAAAVLHKIPIITTITAARAAAEAIEALQSGAWSVKPLQEYYAK
jgi:carbamoyl-phosphate synthase large subunit